MKHTYFAMTDHDECTDIHIHKHTRPDSCSALDKGFLKSSFCSSLICAVWRQSLKVVLSSRYVVSFLSRKDDWWKLKSFAE